MIGITSIPGGGPTVIVLATILGHLAIIAYIWVWYKQQEKLLGGAQTLTVNMDIEQHKKRISKMIDTLAHFLFWVSLPLQIVVAIYLVKPILSLLAYSMLKGRLVTPSANAKEFDFATIVTAHQDFRFIDPLVDSLLKQAHPKQMIYVVADDCDVSGLQFDPARVVMLQPSPSLHSNIKSIRYALDNLVREPDAVIVFDSDNLVHPQYLTQINHFFNAGHRAVMGHIKAKKPQGGYAQLDAGGEIYTNFMYRKASMAMGFSATVDGKGLAVDYHLYRSIDYTHLLGGFDKKVQADLALKVPQVAYAEEAYVYDEKIPDAEALRKQRIRWMNAYFKYFALNSKVFGRGLATLNPNLVYYGLNMLQPPIFLLTAASLLCAGLSLLWAWELTMAWLAGLFFFFLSVIVVLLLEGAEGPLWRSAFKVTGFMWQQLLAMLKMKQANKSLTKTEHHQVIYIEDILP